MKETVVLSENFKLKPAVIYRAWLDSSSHSKMTGGKAFCSNKVGKPHTEWNGYITGKNIELFENQKIVQIWRTSEFKEKDEDSILSIDLKETSKGTKLTLTHKNIPEGQTQYKTGWVKSYLNPMKEYFRH